jgi:flagellar biosynthetic protein FliR
MILGLARSYELVPLSATPDLARTAELATNGLASIFTVAIELAAPVVVALVVTDVALGLVSRAVPQLNVFFVGAPGKIMIGIFVISASLPFVALHLTSNLDQAVVNGLAGLRPR